METLQKINSALLETKKNGIKPVVIYVECDFSGRFSREKNDISIELKDLDLIFDAVVNVYVSEDEIGSGQPIYDIEEKEVEIQQLCVFDKEGDEIELSAEELELIGKAVAEFIEVEV